VPAKNLYQVKETNIRKTRTDVLDVYETFILRYISIFERTSCLLRITK